MQPIRINPKDTTACVCGKCGNEIFIEVIILRSIPSFLIGASTPQFMPIPVFQCSKCGETHYDSLDPNVKELLSSKAKTPSKDDNSKVSPVISLS